MPREDPGKAVESQARDQCVKVQGLVAEKTKRNLKEKRKEIFLERKGEKVIIQRKIISRQENLGSKGTSAQQRKQLH